MSVDEKNIFLIDGIGALISMISLGAVLPALEGFIGMPAHILYLLAVAPALYLVFDAYCFFFLRHPDAKYLSAIIGANTLYCLVSAGVLIHHFDSLTGWGILYFVGELLVLLALIVYEARVFKGAYRSGADRSQ
jgi:hypothetical protein